MKRMDFKYFLRKNLCVECGCTIASYDEGCDYCHPALLELLDRVHCERTSQDLKWGTYFSGRLPKVWLDILMEEVGEGG